MIAGGARAQEQKMNGSTPQLEDLVRALSKRQLLVVVGSLVREAAGLLGPNGLVAKGLEGGVFSDATRVDVRVLAAKGQHAAALELIKTRLGPEFSRVFEPLLAGDRPTPPASLRALALLAGSLPRVLTTNLDNLVELALPGRWAPLAEATADLASRTEVVFKMLGDARHFTTWRFTQDGLKNATYLAPHYRTEVGALLRGHQLLFIGYRGDDELLEELLRLRAHAPNDLNMPQWVALVPPGGLEKREHYGKVGLQLVVLDVPADDPVAYDGAVAEYLKELARAGPAATIDPGALPEPTLTGNPYPGLIPFSEAQAGQFFGREDECRTLVAKLGTSPMGHVRWLMLTGPSGVGKSSLLAAGLVPAIRAGAPPVAGAPTQWCVALLRPGRELLRNLAAGVREALAHDLGQPVAPGDLGREHLLATDRALADFLAPRLQGRGFLLVLDQFEEAFTVGAADERPYLDALLVRGLQDLEVPFYVVTAMRSDCAGDFARHFPRLAEQLNRGTLSARHDLPPLRAHGLHEAVVRPAELAGRVFEAGLVDRILREAGAVQQGEAEDKDAPDATLPLVAHVLHALVEREPASVLSLRAYEALGGVARALTQSADTLLASLRGEYTDAQVRGLLVELVELHPQGRDTRRVLPRAAALAAAGGDAKAEALLLRLSGSTPGHARDTLPVRLVTVHGEGEHAVVDLVHDALLREWATLRGWLGEDREAQLLRRELARATAAWLHQQRSIDELWRGGRLARASETLTSVKLSPDERAFLAASTAQEHAEATAREAEQAEKLRVARRTNRRLLVLGGVLLAASILAFVEYRRADVARADEARVETTNLAGRDIHVTHIHPPAPAAKPATLDIPAYLRTLLHSVENLEIVGIAFQAGRSRDALICPIEQLYTPLTSRTAERPREANNLARHSDRVRMSDILPYHPRLLIIGQPGSGKTTFARLVACMLARDILGPARQPTWRREYLGLPGRRPAPIPGLVRMGTLVGLFDKHSSPGRLDDRTWLLDLLAAQSCPQRSHMAGSNDPDHRAHCDAWDDLLRAGKVLLLLDGLDEVADPGLRARVLRVFQSACREWPETAIVVTSRPIELEMLRALGFHEATIDPFGREEVARFIGQWSAALFAGDTGRSAGHEELLLAAIRERPEIRRLATNPVMLTCLCVIHWNEGRIPDGRARVYRAIFNWMLAARSEPRRRAGYKDLFAGTAFASLALGMMRTPEGKQSSFDLGEAAVAIDEEMQRDFPGLTPAERRRQAREWLLRECEWSHITEEIAGNQLRFWHLTLQEYLAALALAWRDDGEGPEDWWPLVKDHLDDSQWRETVEMLPGCLFDEGGQRRVDRLFERVLHIDQPDLASEARLVGIVGRLLAPMSAYEYALKPKHAAIYEAMRARVMAIFTVEGAARVPLKPRIAAAEALGRAGDPRLGQYNFLEVPGTGVAMGRYPVTVAEFERFVEDEGYATQGWWDPEGWAWRTRKSREAPASWDEQRAVVPEDLELPDLPREAPGGWDEQRASPNRPVTEVAWFEARAYCRWFKARCGARYSEVRLPRADEWERAASPDGRTYPWGEATPTKATANFARAVGAPTPVGLYPAGIGPAGHLDLAGNVFEWCDDGPPEEVDQRCLKGGSWYADDVAWLAAALRFWDRLVDGYDGRGFRVVVVAASRPSRA
jgi:hypothetical protein